MLQASFWMEVYSFINSNSSYLSYFGLDYTQPLSEQMMDEKTTWEQYFLESAIQVWQSNVKFKLHTL